MVITVDRIEMNTREITIHISSPKVMKISFVDRRPAWIIAKVNDRPVGATFCDIFRSPTQIGFMLEENGNQIPAYIEVRYGWRSAKSVRLVIQDKVVASHGDFKTNAPPAEPVTVLDYSLLEKKPSPSRALIALFVLGIALYLPMTFDVSIVEESERYFWLLFGPSTLTSVCAIVFSLKFPKLADRIMGTRHQFMSDQKKLLNRSLISLLTGLFVWLVGDLWLPIINERLSDWSPVILDGTLLDRGSEYKDAQFILNGRTITLPTNTSTAFGKPNETYETVAAIGSLGFYFTGHSSRMKPELAVFLLENFRQPKWIRQYHVKAALKMRNTDWLKDLASNWKIQCDSGLSNYCRLASYYEEEADTGKAKIFLMKACDGRDPIGCYGITESVEASETEKQTAALKLLTMAREAKANCQCFWPAFNKYLDTRTLETAKQELCTGRPKWMCP